MKIFTSVFKAIEKPEPMSMNINVYSISERLPGNYQKLNYVFLP